MNVEQELKRLKERQIEIVHRFARELAETERAIRRLSHPSAANDANVAAISLRLRYWDEFMRIFEKCMADA